VSRFLRLFFWCGLSFVATERALSQSAQLASSRSGSSREELLALAAQAELQASEQQANQSSREEALRRAQHLQTRLREGDFHPGDHIALFVEGEQALTDTFPVREGSVLELPTLGVVSLHGVLRSELQPFLTASVARYVRNPSVRATALVRIAVLGAVSHPGFYFARTDLSLSDVIMRAGGPAASADLATSYVRRGSAITWATDGIRAAFAESMTLDDIEIQSGDAIVVTEQAHFNWAVVSQVITALVGAAVAAVALSR